MTTILAHQLGDAYLDPYGSSYADAVGGGAGDTAHATDAVIAIHGRQAAAADTAHATDAAAATYHPMRQATAADSAGSASDSVTTATAQAPGAATDVGGIHLRVWDLTGTRLLSVIPELEQATVQDERNQPGQLAASLPLSGEGVQALASATSAIIGFYEQGRRVGTFLYDEDTSTDGDPAGPDSELAVTAPGILQVLDWAEVYPQGGFGTPLYADFVQFTPGKILLTVLARAQARGTLDGVNGPLVTCSFSETADSDGTPWPASVWVRYDAGKSMLDVVNDLASRGYVDVQMRGLTLDAYVANGSPDLSRSPVTTQVALDGQGWQAVGGCTVARDATVLPTNVPGVTASTRMTAVIPAVADLQAAAAGALSQIEPAQRRLTQDTVAFAARAKAEHRKLNTTELTELAADRKALALAQKAYAAAESNLAAGMVDHTDMEDRTSAAVAVLGGVSYDCGIDVHADAVTRVVVLSLEFRDGTGASLGGQTVASTTDSPAGWSLLSGQVTTPVDAATAIAHVKVVGANHGEMHYTARLALSPSVGTSLSRDLGGDVTLHRPAYVQSGARRRQRSTIRTALLGLGEANLSLEAADPDAIALYGRREGAASQGGISDFPTLQKLTQLALDQVKRPTLGWTVSYTRQTGDLGLPVPQPWRDYRVGNRIRADWIRWTDTDPITTSAALLPVRVSSITAQYDSGGVSAATLELADIFVDKDVQAQRQIAGLLLGASTADPFGPQPDTTDTIGPLPVSAAIAQSSTFANPNGTHQALATVEWPAVTENTDGSPFDDLGAYTVDFRIGYWPDETGGWQGGVGTQTTEAGFGQLVIGQTFQARVLVSDYNGNYAKNPDGTPAYAYTAAITLDNDVSPPSAPSAPSVTSLPGGVAVLWNGLDVAGVLMPPDYDHVEFHASTVSGFTPTPATLLDTYHGDPASSNTTLVPPQLTYGAMYYVRLVAVNTSGKRSLPGAQSLPVAMRLIGPPDLDPSAIADTDHSGMFAAEDWTAGGSLVTDGASRSGHARQLAAGQSTTGPGYALLKPGRYRATFVLRTDVVAAVTARNVATVDVTGPAVISDGTATVTTRTASSTTGYRTASVKFTVTGAGAIALAVANPFTNGQVWLSHAYVEPVTSLAVAEIRDEFVADLSVTKLTAGVLTADVIAAADANGNPGRIRVGIIDPTTGQPTAPGIEMGARGLRGQAAGGDTTFLVDPTTGQVLLTGSIEVGSTLPGSVYSANLVQNASMEDPVAGTVAGTPGVVPLGWTDGYETTGTASTAYADQAGSIGGSQSLTIRLDNTTSGRAVASSGFAVVPGERLQVNVQLQQTAIRTQVFVRVVYGTAGPSFTRSQHVGATPRTPDNCLCLALDGTVVDTLTGATGPGYVDVAAFYTPRALGTAYKITGSVVVPAGATWARLVVYAWNRGGGTPGSSYTTWDNTAVIRSQDGHTLVAATITGPVLQTATVGPRIVIASTQDQRGMAMYGSDPVMQPSMVEQVDYIDTNGNTASAVRFTSTNVYTGMGSASRFASEFLVYPDGILFDSSGNAVVGIGLPVPGATEGKLLVSAHVAEWSGYAGSACGGVMLAGFDPSGGERARLVVGGNSSGAYGSGSADVTVWNTLYGHLHVDGPVSGSAQNGWITAAKMGTTNLYVNGNAKTFVIDHPTDGERWLVHAAVEGPEAAVVYRGRSRLVDGVAVVELPPYFEAATLAEGRTVHLTPIFRDEHVVHPHMRGGHDVPYTPVANLAASDVVGGAFTVHCAAGTIVADQEFYWQVMAVRADTPALDAEPRRDTVAAHGDGPYRWLEAVPSRP